MTMTQSRRALHSAVKAMETINDVERQIRPNNGDDIMLSACTSARRNQAIVLERLCKIVPNGELMYGHLFMNRSLTIPYDAIANPQPAPLPRGPMPFCDACGNPEPCLCVK